MSSGLDWVEDYDPAAVAESDIIQVVIGAEDHLTFAAEQPPKHEPGTVGSYSSGDTMLLSGVPEQATGMPADEYARRKLFDPIGMEQVEWWRDMAGHTLTYCCLDTTSRDFARFDLVVVRNGTYVKDPGEPIAEPNLFARVPSDALVPGKGSVPPENGWDDREFLTPIVESITGD